MNVMKVITGERARIYFDLKDHDGSVFRIPANAKVTAYIRLKDKKLAGPVTCFDSSTGSDWTRGRGVAIFGSAETKVWPSASGCQIEVYVTGSDGESDAWLSDPFFNIIKGLKD